MMGKYPLYERNEKGFILLLLYYNKIKSISMNLILRRMSPPPHLFAQKDEMLIHHYHEIMAILKLFTSTQVSALLKVLSNMRVFLFQDIRAKKCAEVIAYFGVNLISNHYHLNAQTDNVYISKDHRDGPQTN